MNYLVGLQAAHFPCTPPVCLSDTSLEDPRGVSTTKHIARAPSAYLRPLLLVKLYYHAWLQDPGAAIHFASPTL